ncbi:MAG TPA: hypothetical protein VN033_01040 [Vulgatibacter sp.]|nr:hypothetical protein [Vulgatibacter sp.]
MKKTLLLVAPLALGLAACEPEDDPVANPESGRCEATEYMAFDPVNHAPQDARLDAIDRMIALFAEAAADPTLAAAKAQEIRAIYESPSTNLAAKVEGRKDVHDPDAPLGAESKAAVDGALQMLEDATTPTEVSLAKQRFEKAGMYRFLFHSVLYELWSPSRKHYDEAYGYLGTGETNLPGGRRGLASVATKRDAVNGTTLAEELFIQLLDGACLLETALNERGADEMEVDDDPAYLASVQAMDRTLRRVIAYSIGHELFELGKAGADVDAARIKLAEADGYFSILERALLRGDAAETALATELREAIDDAAAATDDGWIADFPVDHLLDLLQEAFSITVKG